MRPPIQLSLIIFLFTLGSVYGAGMKEMNPPAEPERNHMIALVGGRLIDGQGGQPLENAVVLIQGSES